MGTPHRTHLEKKVPVPQALYDNKSLSLICFPQVCRFRSRCGQIKKLDENGLLGPLVSSVNLARRFHCSV